MPGAARDFVGWWGQFEFRSVHAGPASLMITRSALIYLSRQEGLKDFATGFRPFKKITTRFVAGETIHETIQVISEINAEACSSSFDHLDESVTTAAEPSEEVPDDLRRPARIDQPWIRSPG